MRINGGISPITDITTSGLPGNGTVRKISLNDVSAILGKVVGGGATHVKPGTEALINKLVEPGGGLPSSIKPTIGGVPTPTPLSGTPGDKTTPNQAYEGLRSALLAYGRHAPGEESTRYKLTPNDLDEIANGQAPAGAPPGSPPPTPEMIAAAKYFNASKDRLDALDGAASNGNADGAISGLDLLAWKQAQPTNNASQA